MTADAIARELRARVAMPVAALAGAAAVCAVLILLAGRNPITIYAELVGGTLGSWYGIGQTLAKATPLVFTGLAVALGFRAGLFNIGAEGQMIAGGLAAALTGTALAPLPAIVLLPACIGAAALAGAATAFVPGWLRARRGVHEVISTIMMNFIAAAGAGAVIQRVAVTATVRTPDLPDAAKLPRLSAMVDAIGLHGLGDALRPSPVNAALLLALATAVAAGIWLFRSAGGFELRVLGFNPNAARTAGIDVSRTTMRAMLLSGALAGLGGVSFVLGTKYYYETGFAAGAGFMGIAVALLGRNHPLGVVLAALLFGALSHGGLVINGEISSEIVNVLQALVILFLIAGLARRTPASAVAREETAAPSSEAEPPPASSPAV